MDSIRIFKASDHGRRTNLLLSAVLIATGFTLPVKAETNRILFGGETCQDNHDCFSGHCWNGVCAPDVGSNGTVAAGSECVADSDCYSGTCDGAVCSSDSRRVNYAAGGAPCTKHEHCFSGVCYMLRCAPDGAELGQVAASGWCESDDQCYSGFCRANRCGPDSRIFHVVPSGGHCNTIINWCWSKVCFSGRCTAAGRPGKVGNGGRCRQTYHCLSDSACRDEVCVPSEAPHKRFDSTEMTGGRFPGEPCVLSSQCSASYCVNGFCAPPSPTNRSLIADGGQCDSHLQCQSGYCDAFVCGTSYADHQSLYKAAAGASCMKNENCYCGVCIDNICSSDSPRSLLVDTSNGVVAGGGFCRTGEDCYSGYCYGGMCAPDGPLLGTVADGGACQNNTHCFSGYCRNGKCASSAGPSGRLAAGANCDQEESSCVEGSQCVRGYCTRPGSGMEWKNLGLGEGPCWRHTQCKSGRCLYGHCTAEWFMVEKWAVPVSTAARLPVQVTSHIAVASLCIVWYAL